jgi:hypothetical protein
VWLYLYFLNTPSWRGAQLKHRDIFTFTLLTMPSSMPLSLPFYIDVLFKQSKKNMDENCIPLRSMVFPNKVSVILNPQLSVSFITFQIYPSHSYFVKYVFPYFMRQNIFFEKLTVTQRFKK